MSVGNALVPSAPAEVGLEAQRLIAALKPQDGRSYAEVSKFVGHDAGGGPDYPKITLRARVNGYGQPVASVRVQQTRSNDSDFAGSLEDLDVRTAAEYYMRLDSTAAVDAVEKVLKAPAPKAWALITLLDRMAGLNDIKEIGR